MGILKPAFPLKVYISSYLTYYRRTNTILRSAIVYARKRIALRKTTPKIKSSRNKNSKKLKALKRKSLSIKKTLKNIKHKWHSKKNLPPKKRQKKPKRVTNQ